MAFRRAGSGSGVASFSGSAGGASGGGFLIPAAGGQVTPAEARSADGEVSVQPDVELQIKFSDETLNDCPLSWLIGGHHEPVEWAQQAEDGGLLAVQ